MGKRRRYTDEFRASACLMLEAAGYPAQKGALQRVADHLHMPTSTLQGWANGKHNPPPSELRCEKKDDLIEFIKAEIPQVFRELNDARGDASYRDLMVGIGILVDKWQLLAGGPTKRSEITGPDGKPLAIKTYITVSPDDWDEAD